MFKETCPGSKEIKKPKPEDIRCRYCGNKLEIWTDEVEVKCKKCGKITMRVLGPTCIDWCPYARECVGDEKYKRLKKLTKEK
ncbi:MAG: hypothetical protein HZC12_10015 [Nitrospirae bacterium]|nr:hypothetical protein [Nitrospirota bacterium]